MDEVIVGFDVLVDKLFKNVYQTVNLIINGIYDSLDPTSAALHRELTDPTKQYLRYIFLLLILSPLLNEMEMYSRYPMNAISNSNITFLKNNRKNKVAMERITAMINDLITLVQPVWKQIEKFRKSTMRSK